MTAFESNIEATLMNSPGGAALVYKEGQPVDHLKLLNQAQPLGTWEYVPGTQQVFWSPEVYRLLGLPPAAGPVALKRALDFYQRDDARTLSETLGRAIELRCGFRCKLRLHRADGSFRITESSAAPVLDAGGRLTRLVGTFRDITEQTELENIRRGQQELLVRTIRCMPLAAALLDRNLRYIAWSGRWSTDLNLPERTELLGRRHAEVVPDLAKFHARHIDVAMRGMPMGNENELLLRANGVKHLVDWRIQPWRDKTGEVGGVLLMIHVKNANVARAEGDADQLRQRIHVVGSPATVGRSG